LAVLVTLTHRPANERPLVRPGTVTPSAAPQVEHEPPLVFPEGKGKFHLAADMATLSGGVELRTQGTESILVAWSGPDAAAQWHFKSRDAGYYRVQICYALSADVEGAGYVIEIDGGARHRDVSARGGPGRYKTDELEMRIGRRGEHTLTFRLDPATPPARLQLRSIELWRK
jgi:hypothetical protein